MNLTNEGIRKQSMAVLDPELVSSLLQSARVGYLGLVDDDEPYVVPLNFIWKDGAIYFHGATVGRKAEIISRTRKATFVVSADHGTIANPVPAKTDTAYLSAMVFGEVSIVEELEECTSALQAMLDKYVPGYYDTPLHSNHVESYVSGAGSHVQCFRLTASRITAKQSEEESAAMFYPGRTRLHDVRK